MVEERMVTRSKPLHEAMKAVGFDNIRTYTFTLQHPSGYVKILRSRGHQIEHLLYEYVIVGEKKPHKRRVKDTATTYTTKTLKEEV
jgi:hypothetical protein